MATATQSLVRTSIGKKAVMAVTGLLLYGFVIAHMVGNLKAFQGAEHFNEYAEGLRTLGKPVLGHSQALWAMRLGLLAAVLAHGWAAWSTSRQSKSARPVKYKKLTSTASSYASRTMRWGGVILALFIVYHLLHMTTGDAHPDFIHGDAYGNMVVGFQDWWIVAIYTVAILALGFHVYHGLWSLFQTLGRGSGKYREVIRDAAAVSAVALVVGFLAAPYAILFSVIE